MIRPLRRWHRRLIGLVIVTLMLAVLFAIAYQPPDIRMDTLPAPLMPQAIRGSVKGAPR